MDRVVHLPTDGATTAAQRTYCRLCPALCGVLVTVEGGRVTRVQGDPEHPLSEGYTCPKGRALPAMHHDPRRLDVPELGRGAARGRVPWPALLDDLAGSLRRILDADGPEAVGVYVGTGAAFDGAGRSVAKRFLRALGSRAFYTSGSVDAPNKPLVAELMAGFAGLMPHIDPSTRLTVLIGSNPVVSHGHLESFPNPRRRLRELARRGALWVVDPRRTETARLATRHLAPRPGTDHIWLAAVVRELLATTDLAPLRRRADGVDRLVQAVATFDLGSAAARCGLARADLEDLVAAIREAGRFAAETGTGVSMSPGGNQAEWLMWALLVITDSLDQPGGMWFNPGFIQSWDTRDLRPSDGAARPGPRSRPDLPERFGEYPSAAIPHEIEAGCLRALFVIGGNPVVALPETSRVEKALERVDVLAVADVLPNGTTERATHVLPSVDSLERADLPVFDSIAPVVSAQYTPAVVPPAAERRPVWWILGQVARRLDLDVLGGHDPDRCSDDDVLAGLTRRARAGFAALRASELPLVAESPIFGWVRERLLPDGRWRIAPEPLVDQLVAVADPPPLGLMPRRQLRQVNSLFAGEPVADGRREAPHVILHPDEAAARGIRAGQRVRVTGPAGALEADAAVSDDVRRGAVSVPHGFEEANVNALTDGVELDALTGMPRYSGVPVEVAAL